MINRAIWANSITFSNLFLGYWAIILASQERFTTACWLIVVSAILDGLDGFVARLTRQSSPFGAEIDSFADAISFGLAPSVILYNALFSKFGFIGIVFAFLPTLGGVVRLARYNLLTQKPNKPRGFIGMPIPSSALLLIGYFLFAQTTNDGILEPLILFGLIPIATLLMVSAIPYRRMPVIQINGSRHPLLGISFLLLVTLLMLWNPGLMIFPLMLVYIVIGPIDWIISKVQGAEDEDEDEDEIPQLTARQVRSDKRIRRFFR